MNNLSFQARCWIVSAILAGGIVSLHGFERGEPTPIRQSLSNLPKTLGNWEGSEQPIEQRLLEAAGVDDHLSRFYTTEDGKSAGLYIGYYTSQKKGDIIHSPKNCLPGTGWEPVRAGRLLLPLSDGPPVEVNEYLIQKGLQRNLVLYWYHSRGRVVASEYWGKIWLVADAITRNRTDGSLVRIVVPLGEKEEEEKARKQAVEFAQLLFPRLSEFIPD